jgi:hypothetical protein
MAEIKARLSLDGSAFSAGLAKATAALRGMSSTVATVAAKASAAFAAIGAPLAAGAFAAGIKNAIDYASNISDASARTGIAAGELAVLQQAFQDAGLGADQAASTIQKMQKSLVDAAQGGKETKEAFKQLGLDVAALMSMTPSQQFDAIAKAVANVGNEAEQTALAMKVFGKSGGELKSFTKDPNAMANARQRVGGQAQILDRSGSRLDAVGDAFGAIGTKIRGLFLGAAEAMLPALERIGKLIDSIDLTGLGAKLGKVLGDGLNIIVNAFQQGRLGELAGLSLKIAFGEAINYLAGGLRSALLLLPSLLEAVFSQDFGNLILGGLSGSLKMVVVFLGESLSDVINGISALMFLGFEKAVSVFYKLQDFFKTLVAYLVAGLRQGINTALSYLPDFLKPDNFQVTTFDEQLAQAKKDMGPQANYKPLVSTFDEAFRAVSESGGLKDLLAAIKQSAATDFDVAGEAIKRLFAKIKEDMLAIGQDFKPADIINTAEWKAKLSELAKQLNVPVEALQEQAKKAATTAPAATFADKANIEQDSFAKIGLFAGGAAASGVEYARKTSEATMTLVEMVRAGIRVNAFNVRVQATAG